MARHRRIAGTPQLGESWVVEDEDDDHDYEEQTSFSSPGSSRDGYGDGGNSAVQDRPSRQSAIPGGTPRRKIEKPSQPPQKKTSQSNANASVEPELIMPSLHLDESWMGEQNPRRRREPPRKAIKAEHKNRNYGTRSRDSTTQSQLAPAVQNVTSVLRPMLGWIFDVLSGVFIALKTPISYLLAAWLFIGALSLLRNLFTNSLTTALSPICRLPGSSLVPLCRMHFSNHPTSEPPVEFDSLMTVQSKFEDVLAASAGGVSLPLDMKRGETSIRDLRTVVRHSSLHSKNELVLEFDHFIQTARIASTDLQKFNSHVGRGVDNVLATARWTKRVLDGIALQSAAQGRLASFVNDKLLAPFQPVKFTEDALLDQYIQHTRIVEDEIQRLVLEAQALLLVLTNLEDRLDVIHNIATREDIRAQTSRQEVLSELWTFLGGNRHKVGKLDNQLNLLRQVNTYRATAFAHVSGTMLKLQAMSAELEELRERVGGVELLGGRGGVPLSVHIENIEMGVERLEEGRRRAREMEGEVMRRAVDGGGRREIDG